MAPEVKLTGRKEATSLSDFLAFRNGMMMANLQISGQPARWNDMLNMKSSSCRAKGPLDLRNVGRMLSGPAAPLRFIFCIAGNSLDMLMEVQLSLSTDGVLRYFLRSQLRSAFSFVMWSLLTLK